MDGFSDFFPFHFRWGNFSGAMPVSFREGNRPTVPVTVNTVELMHPVNGGNNSNFPRVLSFKALEEKSFLG